MGSSKNSSKREVYSDTSPPLETRKSQRNNLTLHLKELEKEKQTKPKVSRRKEMIKIRAEINEIETKKKKKINKTKSWFFEQINKINKPLLRLIKKKGDRAQVNKIRNEKGEVTTDTTEVQKIIKDYYEQLYANKIFANDISNKGLISKINKELIELNIKNYQTTLLKIGQRN